MDIPAFWQLMDDTRQATAGNPDKQSELLIEKLKAYSIDDILAFDRICHDLMDRAYIADLWDAAAVIGCGCSDDGFMDFRGWLIQQGKAVYEAALKNPESLVDVFDGF